MDIMSAFPSNYVKASDLQGKEIELAISHVAIEEIGSDRLPVLHFQGAEKGLVLNKTNATNISMVHGQDTDNWAGRRVTLFPATTDYQGRTVPCIRVKGPKSNGVQQGTQAWNGQNPTTGSASNGAGSGVPPAQSANPFDMNDSIPFAMER